MNWIVELVGYFTPVCFHFTLQGTCIIVVSMHMLLPIAFRVMFLLDTMPYKQHFCKKKELMLKDF